MCNYLPAIPPPVMISIDRENLCNEFAIYSFPVKESSSHGA
jgi:hypothetical protein